MKVVLQLFRINATLLFLFTILFGVVYPFFSTFILRLLFEHQSSGSFVRDNKGDVVGSELIGQPFTSSHYFWGRPSATSPYPYNASASQGSNLNPAHPKFIELVKERVMSLKHADPTQTDPIPVDLVTASASGLDPHISLAAAAYQVHRVAKARNLTESHVQAVVKRFTTTSDFFLGEPRVNVLLTNLALDGRL
jgi:K+-transporting ATPase ATPase C chain